MRSRTAIATIPPSAGRYVGPSPLRPRVISPGPRPGLSGYTPSAWRHWRSARPRHHVTAVRSVDSRPPAGNGDPSLCSAVRGQTRRSRKGRRGKDARMKQQRRPAIAQFVCRCPMSAPGTARLCPPIPNNRGSASAANSNPFLQPKGQGGGKPEFPHAC